jgi:hypothetical protein
MTIELWILWLFDIAVSLTNKEQFFSSRSRAPAWERIRSGLCPDIPHHCVKLLGEAEPPGMSSQAGAWEREMQTNEHAIAINDSR